MKYNPLIPTMEQYQEILKKLEEDNRQTTIIALRLGAEMGLTVKEVCFARVSDIDKPQGGLHIDEGAKTIGPKKKDGTKEKRKRDVPINRDLYKILKAYIDQDKIYILKRKKGDPNKPISERYISELYAHDGIPWSTHKSRHFFKNCVWDWMRVHRQMDPQLMSHLMGHKLTTTEKYGSISWEYKRRVIDQVFCPDTYVEFNLDQNADFIDFCAKGMGIPTKKIEFLFNIFSKSIGYS